MTAAFAVVQARAISRTSPRGHRERDKGEACKHPLVPSAWVNIPWPNTRLSTTRSPATRPLSTRRSALKELQSPSSFTDTVPWSIGMWVMSAHLIGLRSDVLWCSTPTYSVLSVYSYPCCVKLSTCPSYCGIRVTLWKKFLLTHFCMNNKVLLYCILWLCPSQWIKPKTGSFAVSCLLHSFLTFYLFWSFCYLVKTDLRCNQGRRHQATTLQFFFFFFSSLCCIASLTAETKGTSSERDGLACRTQTGEQLVTITCWINEQLVNFTCWINEQLVNFTCWINEELVNFTCWINEQLVNFTCWINEQLVDFTCWINEQLVNSLTSPAGLMNCYQHVDIICCTEQLVNTLTSPAGLMNCSSTR